MKHLSTRQLWVQDAVKTLKIDVVKVPRDANMSDCLARVNNAREMAEHLKGMNVSSRCD